MAGPAVFVDGMSVDRGYKVWANGYIDSETRQYGIFISLIDNNIYNPELPSSAPYWRRFSIADIREYNVKVFKAIKDRLDEHIRRFHFDSTVSDSTKLLRALTEINRYSYFSTVINLGQFRKINLPNGKQLLEYTRVLSVNNGYSRILGADIDMDINIRRVKKINSREAYKFDTGSEEQDITQSLSDQAWNYVLVQLPSDGTFASSDYHVMVSSKIDGNEVKAFVYRQAANKFSLALRYSDNSQDANRNPGQICIHCVGEAL